MNEKSYPDLWQCYRSS